MISPVLVRPVGFNFGGWTSQSDLSDPHVLSFIQKKDFETLAQWGFNSVRLPVDGAWLFEEEGSGKLAPRRLAFLKEILGWARDAQLLTILDIHSVPWHSFGNPDLENLWKNEEDLGSFCRAWAELAHALKGFDAPVWFDILNEPTAQNSSDWNRVANQVCRAIEAEDANRILMVESTFWGSVTRLKDLVQGVKGANLVYSFHFYLPMFVTHQGAPWWKEGHPYQERVDYPGPLPKVGEYLKKDLPSLTRWFLETENREWNKEALREILKPVVELAREGYGLYCGEFGVYEKAPRQTRLNWTRDVVDLFRELKVGWAYWNYKWLDFGIWPKTPAGQTGPLDEEMLQILRSGIE